MEATLGASSDVDGAAALRLSGNPGDAASALCAVVGADVGAMAGVDTPDVLALVPGLEAAFAGGSRPAADPEGLLAPSSTASSAARAGPCVLLPPRFDIAPSLPEALALSLFLPVEGAGERTRAVENKP